MTSLSAQIEALSALLTWVEANIPGERAAKSDFPSLFHCREAIVTLQQHERLVAEIAEMEAGYKNAAELVLTYHGKNERLEAVVDAARRANESLRLLMRELTDPGTEALAAQWELQRALAALGTAAPDKPEDAEAAEARYLGWRKGE